jgi:hypothetical protein
MGAAMKKPQPATNYQVGYGRPPVHSRFRPGQSGNPRGRPKGARNRVQPLGPLEERFKSLVLEEAYRPVNVKDSQGRQVTVPMAQAVMRAVGLNAVKGSQWAQRHFTELLSATERDRKLNQEKVIETALEYKHKWERELEHRAKHGLSGPEPLPHPDHVSVNMRTGEVRMIGPLSKEEKALLERARRNIRDTESELAYLRGELAKEPGSERWKEEIESEEYMLALLRWNEGLLTGADPEDLIRPVRPLSVERRMAKYKGRIEEWRRRGFVRQFPKTVSGIEPMDEAVPSDPGGAATPDRGAEH